MQRLCRFLRAERRDWATYPSEEADVFRAFSLTPFKSVKVVILGQDPYRDAARAMGLAFSVPDPKEVRPYPSSLRNIYTAIESDLGIKSATDGNLTPWAEVEGVLLLNTVLTRGKAGSHAGRGWECFTDKAIELLNRKRKGLVFLLWGKEAKTKAKLVETSRGHKILCADHPAAPGGDFLKRPRGRGHFSETNRVLAAQGSKIHW